MIRKGSRCLHEVCHDSIAIYNLPIHQLLGEWLTEFPAILDKFFTGVANISSTPAGWGVGGKPQSGGQRIRLD